MSEIDPAALRHALREELGDARFSIFVRDSHASRFKWWQEKAWERFVERFPHFKCEMDALRPILCWCPLHDVDLRRGIVELFHGCMDFAADWESEARRAFPYASSGPIPTQGRPTDATTIEVSFCPVCREAEAVWQDENRGWAIPKAWLLRRVEARTVEALVHDDLSAMALPASEIEALLARGRSALAQSKLAEFLAKMQPGDEIWRFESAPQTWATLSGRAGYGLVRGGRCIEIVVTLRN